MVSAGFSGVLRNYRGNDTTKLDFIHVFEKGELVRSVFYYQNGKIEKEYFFKCASLHGDQKFYYESGKPAKIVPYRYGRSNGLAKVWDEKGILRQEALLAADSIVSIKTFDEKGVLIKN
jgi:antitoxin component YwqK of YwqJK toxin-antitoxin module